MTGFEQIFEKSPFALSPVPDNLRILSALDMGQYRMLVSFDNGEQRLLDFAASFAITQELRRYGMDGRRNELVIPTPAEFKEPVIQADSFGWPPDIELGVSMLYKLNEWVDMMRAMLAYYKQSPTPGGIP